MIKAAARFFLLSLVFQALEGSPDPLDTINVHFHLGDDTETGGEHGIEPPDSVPANDAKPESASTPAAPAAPAPAPPIQTGSGGSPGPAPETGAKGSAGAGPKPESGAKSKEDSEEDTEHEDYHMPEPEPETKPKWGPKWGPKWTPSPMGGCTEC